MRIHKVINTDHVKVFLQQLDNTVRADIPVNEKCHFILPTY